MKNYHFKISNFAWIVSIGLLLMVFLGASISVAEMPKKLKIATILATGPDEPWDGALLEALKIVKAEKPYGLEINDPVYSEGVWGDSAEAVAKLYAKKGFDIVWLHSTYSDQVKKLMNKYPKTLFVVVGSGNQGLGKNQYWVYMRGHEPAYIQGIVSGMMTKSNILGAVASFPADDVYDAINSFIMGAESVNTNVKRKVSFIESWYDPPKAKETANAQFSAGADNILMISAAFESCTENKIFCHGYYKDWLSMAPDSIMTSLTISWVPHLRWVIDEWVKAKAAGKPFNGNMEPKWFSMAEGGSDIV
ncbi:MAG: BMP family protein, partial [Deltaproteobacteria bacterium]|nr:BMP family protein [Deltaproteobacteria bacterium]